MNDLEKIINKNRRLFDDREPDPGHFERFNKKLNTHKRKIMLFYTQVAAIVIAGMILAGLSFYLIDRQNPDRVLSRLSPDMQETLYYYNTENSEMIDELKSLSISDNSIKKQILNDLNSYEENYRVLLNDLKKYPNDERVLNALIEVHRSRNEFLHYVLVQVKNSNDQSI
jgi:hypothetical protein